MLIVDTSRKQNTTSALCVIKMIRKEIYLVPMMTIKDLDQQLRANHKSVTYTNQGKNWYYSISNEAHAKSDC